MRDVPEALRCLLEISGAAQLLFDGDRLAAASGPARQLFPEAEPGAEARTLFGENAEVLARCREGHSLLFTLDLEGRMCDVTAAVWEGFILCTAEPSADQLSLTALDALGQSLRRPLTAILALAPRFTPLLEDCRDQKTLDQAAEMNQSIYAMLRVVGNLQLESGESLTELLRPSRYELDLWLEQLTQRVEPLCREAGLTLRYLPEPGRYSCIFDGEMLQRAMLNLVSNAIKFSEPGGEITLRLRHAGRRLWITLEDQGCGIPADQMAQVFRRSEHRGVTPDPRWGVGLGLPLARRIVQAHGGTLLLESVAGAGTQVHIALEPRRDQAQPLRTPVMVPDFSGGVNTVLLELADVLPPRLFDPRGTE